VMPRLKWEDVKDDWEEYKDDNKESVNKCCCCGILGFILVLVIFLTNTFAKVASTEYGLAYNSITANLKEEVLTEGLRMHPPFGKIILWPSVYQTLEFQDETEVVCNSKDGVQISIDLSFQHVPRKDSIFKLTKIYETFERYQNVVYVTSRSAIRHGCQNVTALEFQTERSLVRKKMETALIESVEALNSRITGVQLRNIRRPAIYETAVSEKETARADIDLAENERQQKVTVVNTELDEATKLAVQIADTASTEASITLSFATNNAASAKNMYEEYASIYGAAKRELNNMSVPGILAYMGNSLFGPNEHSKIQVASPVQVSYKDDL